MISIRYEFETTRLCLCSTRYSHMHAKARTVVASERIKNIQAYSMRLNLKFDIEKFILYF